MKKNSIKVTMVLVSFIFLTGVAAAAITITGVGSEALNNLATGSAVVLSDTTGGGTAIPMTLSPKVFIRYNSTAAGLGADYSMITFNSQGYRLFGVASDFSGIWFDGYEDDAAMLADAGVPTAMDSSTAFNGWSVVGD